MLDIAVLYCQSGHSSTAIGPTEIFHSAGVFWNLCTGAPTEPRFRVTTASVDGKPVRSDAGTVVTPDCAIGDIARTDMVFVPTAGFDIDRVIEENRASLAWMKDLRAKGTTIAAVCTGVALVAEAGLLDGRRSTTHWAAAELLRQRYPKVDWRPELCLTEDRGVLCSGGVYSSLDLALYIVEKHCGRSVALDVAKAMVLQMPRTYQMSFAVLPIGKDHGDAMVKRAEEFLFGHFAEEIDLDRLARDLGVTTRTFIRRFKAATGDTPLAYLQHLRIEAAKPMLEQDRLTVQEVGLAVGYEDVSFFRGLFRRHVGLPPRAYRDRFGRSVHPAAA